MHVPFKFLCLSPLRPRRAMHRALAVPEIARLITRSVAPADADDDRADVPIDRATYCTMRSLMTVSRVFSEPALDRLWESATPWRLGVLMPSSMVGIQIAEVRCPIEHYRQVCSTLKHRKIGAMSALLMLNNSLEADMRSLASSRFFYYSRRVKCLSASPSKPPILRSGASFSFLEDQTRVQEAVDSSVLLAWQHEQSLLFPALRSVRVVLPGDENAALFRFVTPHTTSFSISMSKDSDSWLPKHLVRACTGLRHIEANISLADSDVHQNLRDIISNAPRLESVLCGSSLDYDTIVRLGSYRCLTHLVIHGMSTDAKQQLPSGCFPSLVSVDMSNEVADTSLFRQFLAYASPMSLRRLTFRLQPTRASVLSTMLLDIVPNVGRFKNLTHVALHIEVTDSDRFDVDAPQRTLTTLRAMNAFAGLYDLEELWVCANFYMKLPELHEMGPLPCWPRLKKWVFASGDGRSLRKSYRICHLSFDVFLEILLRCPRLNAFAGDFQGTAMPSEEAIVELEELRHPFRDKSQIRMDLPNGQMQKALELLHRVTPNMNWCSRSETPKVRVDYGIFGSSLRSEREDRF